MTKYLRTTMPDGSKWDVPVDVIARDRATYYADEFGNDIEKSLSEDTLPLFNQDPFEIEDWAKNSMNWEDVAEFAKRVENPPGVDFNEGWVNGEKKVIEY